MTLFITPHSAKVRLDRDEYLVNYRIAGDISERAEFPRAYVEDLEIEAVFTGSTMVPVYPGFAAALRAELWKLPVDDYLYEAWLKAADDAANPTEA